MASSGRRYCLTCPLGHQQQLWIWHWEYQLWFLQHSAPSIFIRFLAAISGCCQCWTKMVYWFIDLADLWLLLNSQALHLGSQVESHSPPDLLSYPCYPKSSCICSLEGLTLLLQRSYFMGFFFFFVCVVVQFDSHSYVGRLAYPWRKFCSFLVWVVVPTLLAHGMIQDLSEPCPVPTEERVVPIEVCRSKLSKYLQGVVFRCDKCTFTCSSDESLQQHIEKHNELKPYKCQLCYYETKHTEELDAHLRDEHKVSFK